APLSVLWGSRYLRLIFIMVITGCACAMVLVYVFKVSAARQLNEHSLAAYFGKFYAYAGIIQLVVQFVLTAWLLQRFGIIPSLIIMPARLTVGAAGFFVHPPLLVASAAAFINISLEETLDLSARELLCLPLAARMRVRAQALVDGALQPLGQGCGGLTLLLVP